MCFVVDDDTLGYYLMFNLPIGLYFLMFMYTWIRYEHGALAKKPSAPVAADSE